MLYAYRRALEDNAILKDKNFKKKFPKIEMVAAFLYHALLNCQGNDSPIPLFNEKGIKSVQEYLGLLDKVFPDRAAVNYYKTARDNIVRYVEMEITMELKNLEGKVS